MKFAQQSRYDSKEVMFVKKLLQFGLELEVREKIVDELFIRLVGIDQACFSRELYMTTEQIKTMSRNRMHIGCHGYNHFWWNKLSRSEMEAELDMSLKFLYQIGVDPNLWTASYPYGSYDAQSIELLKLRGCKYALTTEVGIATTSFDKRFILPRLDTNDIPKLSNSEVNVWYTSH
jgi:peptidoglycan/xylan/chitin deacetylase (PgdA/CDA1 family)